MQTPEMEELSAALRAKGLTWGQTEFAVALVLRASHNGQRAMRERAALESLAFGGNPSMVRAIRALPVEE